jgi:thiamine kinase-like enzyme
LVAVPGVPVAPNYRWEMPEPYIYTLWYRARRLRTSAPQRRWFRRLNSARRLHLAHRAGWLTAEQRDGLLEIARRVHARVRFGHGDLTARNVMRDSGGMTLIDWEWAGLYPDGYELAFLWYSLVDTKAGRARVEAQADSDERAFLLSALLIQLWHLQNYIPTDFRPKHLATRDDLIDRLLR